MFAYVWRVGFVQCKTSIIVRPKSIYIQGKTQYMSWNIQQVVSSCVVVGVMHSTLYIYSVFSLLIISFFRVYILRILFSRLILFLSRVSFFFRIISCFQFVVVVVLFFCLFVFSLGFDFCVTVCSVIYYSRNENSSISIWYVSQPEHIVTCTVRNPGAL